MIVWNVIDISRAQLQICKHENDIQNLEFPVWIVLTEITAQIYTQLEKDI